MKLKYIYGVTLQKTIALIIRIVSHSYVIVSKLRGERELRLAGESVHNP